MRRTRARYRRIPATMRRMPGGRSGGTGGGGQASSGVEALVGLSGFSAANFMQTAAGGGEAGVASGFLVAALFRALANTPSATEVITANTAPGITQGYYLRMDGGGGAITLLVGIDGSPAAAGAAAVIIPSELGRLHLCLLYLDASAIGLWIDRNKRTSAAVNVAGYQVPVSSQTVGRWLHDPAQTAKDLDILAVASYRGRPTDAQVQAYFDAARSLGDLPATMGGTTPGHRHSLRDELRGTVVVDGQLAPAQLADTITRAPVDALARVGSPVVRVIDPAIDGRRTLGAQGFSAANYLQGAVGGGLIGAAGQPYWFAIGLTVDSLTATANDAVVSQSNAAGNAGWELNWQSTTILRMMHGGAGFTPGITLTASDVGVPMMLLVQYTGTVHRLYARGVQVGSDTALGYGPAAGSRLKLGLGYSNGFRNGSVSSFAGGLSSLTPAQITQAFSDFATTGRVQPIAGATACGYDLTTDTLASGVDAVPAVVLDRVGTDNLTRVGGVSSAGGLTLAQRTERLWSYETSPILYGVNALTDADYYETTDGVAGHPAGWWYALPFVLESQSVPSVARTLVGKLTPLQGWDIRTNGTNSTLSGLMITGDAGAYVSSPSAVLNAADVGKLLLFFLGWDGSKLHGWIKRAEAGTGNAGPGCRPALPTDSFKLGRHGTLSGYSATGIRILGGMGGVGAISFAEVCAAHDAFLAREDLVEVPGKTDFLVSVKLDTLDNGGVIPTTLKNRKGPGVLTKIGNPQLAPIFARAAAW
jgi:hypothetical protein